MQLNSNSNLSKLRLPEKTGSHADSYPLYHNEKALISGFGFNQISLEMDPDTKKRYEVGKSDYKLRFYETVILSNDECGNYYKTPMNSHDLCAKVEESNSKSPTGVCTVI